MGGSSAGVRWRMARGALKSLTLHEYGRKNLLKLASAAVVWECVGTRLMEQGQV